MVLDVVLIGNVTKSQERLLRDRLTVGIPAGRPPDFVTLPVMEREQIVRDDFPTARKGWSPEAVRAHLIAVAAAYPESQAASAPAAAAASERVQSVIAAAETAAAEIVSEAQSEADRILGAARAEAEQIRAAARAESEQTVTAANREATGRVEQARGAVEGLIAQADKLRAQVGALGRDLASNVPGSGVSAATAGADDMTDPAGKDPPDEAPPDPPRGGAAGRARGRARADPQAGTGRAAEQRGSDLPAPRVDRFDRGDWVDRRGGGADRAARGDAPARTWERRDWSP